MGISMNTGSVTSGTRNVVSTRRGGALKAGGAAAILRRRRTRPITPAAASTYHGPPLPSSTADPSGSLGGLSASNTRSGPATSFLPEAAQRPWPDESSRRTSSGRLAGDTLAWAFSPSIMRARARAASPLVAVARMRRGVMGSARPLFSPTICASKVQACGGSAGARSNRRRRRSGVGPAGAAANRDSGCTARRTGKRSSAASSVAARWTQFGARQVQRLSNTGRRPSVLTPTLVFWCLTPSSTAPAMASPSTATSTAPISTRLRPRFSTLGSKMRPRSSAENGIAIRHGSLMRGRSFCPGERGCGSNMRRLPVHARGPG